MKSDESLAAEQSLEAKLGEIGLGRERIDVRGEAAPDPGTPAETVSETVADEQPRNELGQFAAVDEPEANEVAPEPEAEVVDETTDPDVASYLAKYGGDMEKAIQAAVHAQKQLGKQSTEVGELRAENAQYEALIEELRGLRSDMQEARPQPQLDQATVDWFDEQAMNNPYGAAEYARQQGNNMLLQRALTTWKDIDPYAASVYTNELRLQEQQRQFEEQLSKAQQLPVDATINVALTNVMGRNPEYSSYSDLIETTLQKHPAAAKIVQDAAAAGDMATLEAGIETLYALARGDTLQHIVRTGTTPEETTTTTDVVAPTVSEAIGEEQVPLTPSQQMKAAMNEEIANRRRGVFVAE